MDKITIQQSVIIKGCAILLVILHHYAQTPDSLRLLKPFVAFGPVAVSAFYFISGYGLSVSKKEMDVTYWVGRFYKVIVPFVLANMIYMGYYYNNISSYFDGVLYLFGLKLINPICWYMQVLLLMYVAFAFSGRLTPCYRYILILIFGFVYTFITKTPGCVSWLAFLIGIYLSDSSIDFLKLSKGKWPVVIILFVSCTVFYALNDYHLNTTLSLLNFVCLIFISPFVFFITTYNMRDSIVLKYLGLHSMDYYLMHYLCLQVILNCNILSSWTSFCIYLISVAIVSTLFGLINKKIVKK